MKENLYCALNNTRAIDLIHYFNTMNVGIPPPLFFFCCCKDGHNTGQNTGTKIGRLEFQFDPTMITCNVIQAIYIVEFTN